MKRALKVILKSDLSGWGKVEGLTDQEWLANVGSRRAVHLALGEKRRGRLVGTELNGAFLRGIC